MWSEWMVQDPNKSNFHNLLQKSMHRNLLGMQQNLYWFRENTNIRLHLKYAASLLVNDASQ